MLTIVTAASSNHYKSVLQFLRSCPTETTIFMYDIGLSGEEVPHLREQFPQVIYKKLDFSLLPDFAHIDAPYRGAYAWKPYIMNEVYSTLKDGILIWCDAGNRITNLPVLLNVARTYTIYSPSSCGMLNEMTHPDTLRALHIDETRWNVTMRNAALITVHCNKPEVTEFLTIWKEKCFLREVILPIGCSFNNHRFDQSVLSCLMCVMRKSCPVQMLGVKTHCDCD